MTSTMLYAAFSMDDTSLYARPFSRKIDKKAKRFMRRMCEEDLERHGVRAVDVAEFARLNQPLDYSWP